MASPRKQSPRYRGIEKVYREHEAQKTSWKTYRGTIHVEIKAPDKRAARKALEGIQSFALGWSAEVNLDREGPEEVS